MLKYIFRIFLIPILILSGVSRLQAQEERRLSLNIYGGAGFFLNEKKTATDLPSRVLGGFKPSPIIGAGFYYRITRKLYVGENYMFLINANKDNQKLSSHTFRTCLKYHLWTGKKITPYAMGSINFNMVTLARKSNEYNFIPSDPNGAIGPGYILDSIYYRNESLKLSNMPMLGGSIGAGFDIRLGKRFSTFVEYSFHTNFAKNNKLMNEYYFYNQSNFGFHTATAGITMKLFKPQKQLLATLPRDAWRNSKPIDVKGTIIYKNPKKTYEKVLDIERTDTLENVQQIDQTDPKGVVFFSRGLEMGDYQFMLAKKHRKILRADLQILNYNRIEIADDELELEMVEDEVSENILSRDANFVVLLREGFQHEIELTTTAENIMGTFTPTDTNCRVRIILKDMNDSIVSVIDTIQNGKFNFVNVTPGNYKMIFQRLNDRCKDTDFKYGFTGATPYVRSQFNNTEPKDTAVNYNISGNVSMGDKPEAPKGTVARLIDPNGKVESKTNLAGAKTGFEYKDLKSPSYSVVYDDPSEKATLGYKVKDNRSNLIRDIKLLPPRKGGSAKGDIQVKGKVELPNPAQAKTVSVMLVDSSGKVKQKLPVNPDGTFSFSTLPKNKYRVVYESTDPLVSGKLKYSVIDKSLKINRVILPELFATAEDVDTIHLMRQGVDAINQDGPVITEKTLKPSTIKVKDAPIKYAYLEFKPNTTYTDQGVEVKPEGYGVQVASFFINSNLEKFCARIRAKGEKNIFIQVILKDRNNPSAGYIYRVIVGADKDRERTNKKINTYVDKGYDAVLRKHLE